MSTPPATTPAPGIPDWVRSQRRAARQCELCGDPAIGEHRDSGTGRDELLCAAHLDTASDRIRAREQAAAEDAAAKLDQIRRVLAAFDWERDDRQYALEKIERIVSVPGDEGNQEQS